MRINQRWNRALLAGGLAFVTISAAAATRAEAQPPRYSTFAFWHGARLGVSVKDMTAAEAERQKVSGVLVEDVEPNSAAEKSGIKKGDLIVEFDGEHVRSVRQLLRLVREAPAGRPIRLALLRDGARTEVSVTLDAPRRDFWIDGDRLREHLPDLGALADRFPNFDFDGFEAGTPTMPARYNLLNS